MVSDPNSRGSTSSAAQQPEMGLEHADLTDLLRLLNRSDFRPSDRRAGPWLVAAAKRWAFSVDQLAEEFWRLAQTLSTIAAERGRDEDKDQDQG